MRNWLIILCPILITFLGGRATAGIILEFQTFQGRGLQGSTLPENAKPEFSIEVRAEPSMPFLTRIKLGDRMIEVNGKLQAIAENRYRVAYQFSDTTTTSDGKVYTNSWRSNVELSLGQIIPASGGPNSTTFIQFKPELPQVEPIHESRVP